jgi:hypothetical protein
VWDLYRVGISAVLHNYIFTNYYCLLLLPKVSYLCVASLQEVV